MSTASGALIQASIVKELSESKNFDESWYTADGINWTLVKSDPMWSPRHEPTIYVYDGSLWLAAGNMWPLMNDVWKLTMKP